MAEPGGISEYLGIFLDEADEQVETLDQGLLRLEREPADQDLLQEIFRAAHSLKSAAAAMGFANMARLTHGAEDLLDKFRSGEKRPQTAAIDALLAAVDALKQMKESIRSGGRDDLEASAVTAALSDLSADAREVGPHIEPETARFAQADTGSVAPTSGDLFVVRIRLADDCEMPAVRGMVVLRALATIGEVIESRSSKSEILAGGSGRELEVLLRAEGEGATGRTAGGLVARALESVPEIASCDVSLAGFADDELILGQSSRRGPKDERAVDVGPAGRGRPPGEISAMARRGDQTVRVNVARLDRLMNLVGELVIDRTRVFQLGLDLIGRHGPTDLTMQLKETSLHMSRIVGDLQEEVMKARMLPIAQLFRRFPRMIRDLAQKMGKEVEFILEGEDTELDRSVIEEMVDPLTHLLRNAVDHGVEPPGTRELAGKARKARLLLGARQLENRVLIEVTDDGAGIDVEQVKEAAVARGMISAAAAAAMPREEALQLVFAAGLSTAGAVSDVSGRGVGMDVVRSNVSRLHGSVRIQTKLGVGTTVTVSLPLTLAISQALLVTVGPAVAAIPLVYVVETTRVSRDDLYTIRKRLVTPFRGRVLPLVALSEVLEQGGVQLGPQADLIRVVVARSGDQEVGLIVDSLVGEQEIVLKPLGAALGEIVGLSGATILGNGTVALALDVASLIDHATLQASLASEDS